MKTLSISITLEIEMQNTLTFFLLSNLNFSLCSFSPLLLILYCKSVSLEKTCVPMNMITGFCCLGFSLHISCCGLFTVFSLSQ